MKTNLLLASLIGINFGLSAQVTDTGDKVGVGTTNPSQKLEVNGGNIAAYDSGNTYVLAGLNVQNHFRIGYDGTGGILESFLNNTNSGTHIKFNTGLLTRMTIADNGNVGIGTSSPNEPLEVAGTGRAFIGNGGGPNRSGVLLQGSGTYGRIAAYDYGMSTAMNLALQDSGGNVGIGTTSPNESLEVAGNGRVFIGNGGGPNRSGILLQGLGSYARILAHDYGMPSGMDLVLQDSGGNVGIGTTNPGAWKLAVNGKIRAKEIKVETGWSDFVFEKEYDLPTLKEVEQHIKENGHLKDIPSAKEVEENGIFLGEMDSKLLQKIEELTLYTIQQEKRIIRQAEKIENLESLNNKLLELQKRLEKLEKE